MFSCLLLDFFLIIHVEMWEEKSNERENWHFHISHIIRLWLCEWGVKKLRQEREREKNWMSEGCECISWNLFRFRFILRNVQFLSCIGWKKNLLSSFHFINSHASFSHSLFFLFTLDQPLCVIPLEFCMVNSIDFGITSTVNRPSIHFQCVSSMNQVWDLVLLFFFVLFLHSLISSPIASFFLIKSQFFANHF